MVEDLSHQYEPVCVEESVITLKKFDMCGTYLAAYELSDVVPRVLFFADSPLGFRNPQSRIREGTLCSKSMKFSGGKPTQARNIFTIHCLCAASAFTTGTFGADSGALSK